MTTATEEDAALASWLVTMQRRRRAWRLLDAVARIAAGVAVAVAGLCAIDRAVALPEWLRVSAALGVVIFATAGLAIALFRCGRRFDPVSAAAAIERRRPALDERLITLATLPADVDSSIRRRLRGEARAVIDAEPLHVAWRVRRTVLTVMVAGALCVAIPYAVHRLGWTLAARRVLQPWAAIPPVSSSRIRLTASATVLRRSDPSVVMQAELLGGADDEPVVLHVTDRTGETTIAMTPQGRNRFVTTLSDLLQGVRVVATAGDVRSRTIRITLAPPTPKVPRTK